MPEPPPLQTLETRLVRIEAMLEEIKDRVDDQFNDIEKTLSEIFAYVEKIGT